MSVWFALGGLAAPMSQFVIDTSPPCIPIAPPPMLAEAVIWLLVNALSEMNVWLWKPPPTMPAPPMPVVSRPPVINTPEMWNTKSSATLGLRQMTRSDVVCWMIVEAEPAPLIVVLAPATSRSPTFAFVAEAVGLRRRAARARDRQLVRSPPGR
jgi:hypothetical protein